MSSRRGCVEDVPSAAGAEPFLGGAELSGAVWAEGSCAAGTEAEGVSGAGREDFGTAGAEAEGARAAGADGQAAGAQICPNCLPNCKLA